MADKTLSIIINAKNMATGAFNAAGAAVRNFFNQTQQLEGGLGTLLKVGGAMAAAGLAKQTAAAADAASKAARDFVSGEMSAGEFVGQAARGIPVLGDFTKAIDEVTMAAFDSAAAFAKWGGASAETVRGLQSVKAEIEELNKRAAVSAKVGALSDRLSADRPSGNEFLDRQHKAEAEFQKTLAEINRLQAQAQNAGEGTGPEVFARMAQKAAQIHSDAMTQIFGDEVEAARRIGMERQAMLDKDVEAVANWANEQAAAAEKAKAAWADLAAARADLESEVKQARLKFGGDDLGAQIEGISRRAAQQLRGVTNALQRSRIEELREIEIMQAKKDAAERAEKGKVKEKEFRESGPLGPVAAVLVNERFRGLTSGNSADPQREAVAVANKGVRANEKQVALLEDIRREMRNGGGLVGRIIRI